MGWRDGIQAEATTCLSECVEVPDILRTTRPEGGVLVDKILRWSQDYKRG